MNGTQWFPYVEWSLHNPDYSGNPYDLVADVRFHHAESGEKRVTQMFYDGEATWKFRFTGTRTGDWVFTSFSNHSNLDGLRGVVRIEANPDPKARGFITNYQNKWMWMGNGEVFVPQYVMYRTPKYFVGKPGKIDADIDTWFGEHGFNGLHVRVYHAWFDISVSDGDGKSGSYTELKTRNPNPDLQTFEALELLISKVHKAGGVVHIWMWGDEDRKQTPKGLRGGINGRVDRRLQRYIAARLGPIPGWTMGYGFDNWEWNGKREQEIWHSYMQQHFAWPHMLGARWEKNQLTQVTEILDYSSYEQHKPDYRKYVETIEARSHKPSFSEDRFRVRGSEGRTKDYSLEETRRGLWHSTMAGGVANIWGNMVRSDGATAWDEGGSNPYPNKHELKTYSIFFSRHFVKGMERANLLTDGYALKTRDSRHLAFYREDAESISMDLSSMPHAIPAAAVDAKKDYREIDLGTLAPRVHSISFPYSSDWAVAVGAF